MFGSLLGVGGTLGALYNRYEAIQMELVTLNRV